MAGLAAIAASPTSTAAPSAPGSTSADLQAFVASLWPEAQGRGLPRDVFDQVFAGMLPDPQVAAMTRRQPEFVKPIGAYLDAQLTAARVSAGQAMARRWSRDLDGIEHRYGVPRSIIVAIWGLETAYGVSTGGKDVIRSMATLASMNYRPALYRAELLAALAILQDGEAPRELLRGSWAGAMGLPQFMPTSFRTYAVDWERHGRRDIWTSVPDALASIANFVRQQGWLDRQPWGFAVTLPAGFDYRVSRLSSRGWAALGVTRADHRPMPADGDEIMFFPAGAAGPAFLVTANFEVLKTYNFSDAYVLAVAQLADRIDGAAPLALNWPSDPPMSRQDRIELQTRLVALGYAVDNREGRISLALRDVIRTAQTRVNLVPDGNPTLGLLQALRALPDPR